MIIGIPKEIKNNENRVALTPSGACEMIKHGHRVCIQASAGANTGFPDEAYAAVGAEILPTIEEIYAQAEMIVKVKEPIAPEYGLIRKDQLVFTYFHFASSEPLTRAMIDSGAVCCAYETVERADRSLPLLIPMSEVAGRMSTQEGLYFLEKPHAEALQGESGDVFPAARDARCAAAKRHDGKVVDGDGQRGQGKQQIRQFCGRPDAANAHLQGEHEHDRGHDDAQDPQPQHLREEFVPRHKISQPLRGKEYEPCGKQKQDRSAGKGRFAHIQHFRLHFSSPLSSNFTNVSRF